jgi:hypothetical protein
MPLNAKHMSCTFVLAASLATTASAQNTPDGFLDLTYTGTVQYERGDAIVLRNPGGSTTTISSADIPDYRFAQGQQLTTTYRIDLNSPAFSNAACGGRYALGFAQQRGSCTVEVVRITTPFGNAGFGGFGGDSPPSISGLEIVRDPVTGQNFLDFPNGSYSFRYVGVNPYFYDSRTGALTGPTGERCVDAFSCLAGVGIGTAASLMFDIPVAGDFGLVRPGLNVGYNAGSVGSVNILGGFSLPTWTGSSGGGPVDVPEPPMLILFAFASVAAMRRARRRKRA